MSKRVGGREKDGGQKSSKKCHVLFEWPLRVTKFAVIIESLAV